MGEHHVIVDLGRAEGAGLLGAVAVYRAGGAVEPGDVGLVVEGVPVGDEPLGGLLTGELGCGEDALHIGLERSAFSLLVPQLHVAGFGLFRGPDHSHPLRDGRASCRERV